ncbi:hypothetical protein PM082_001250 [Marasmius tenuissimus]|nr:hypothetical protein PM082_001250 [Marasmius tenuissimus]
MSLIRSRLAYGCKPARYASASFSSTSALAAKYRKTPVLPSAEKRIQLPPIAEWKDAFPSIKITRGRVSIANEAAAQQAANAFVPKGSRGKTVIEVFPGPGQLTRALLNLPKKRIERLIVLEDTPEYLEWLRPLEQADPRLKVIHWSGMDWESYEVIKKEGLLDDIKEISWDAGVHPQLQFVSHLPENVSGEQLISQLIRLIPERQWLFKYGRIPMNFLLNIHVWQRLVSRDLQLRCKLTAVADATVDCEHQLSKELQPYREKFYCSSPVGKKSGGVPQFQAISVIPKEEQVRIDTPYTSHAKLTLRKIIQPGDMEIWDYCLRRLFVQRATPLQKSILSLGPGAQTLLEMTKGVLDHNISPRELPMSDWAKLIEAFKDWPFAPQVPAPTCIASPGGKLTI